ncbi:MAG: Fic family protein [Bacteroides sp.]|nr:Fic family protein [Roseburia sp.]MCM1346054.1 Fic family protein [Bacteroides sp.]MCM1420576.1 Fic family protein [Bacteroides sp.]
MRQTVRHTIYIWQHKDWPEFCWDSAALLEPLSRLSQLHGLLHGRMLMQGFNEKNNSQLSVLTEELISSSEIEGVSLNPHSVRSSIARRLGIEDDGLLVEDHYVEGLVDVMLDAVCNCCAPLTDERLFGWHSALFPLGRSGMHRITVAGWRTGDEPMQVVSGALGHEKVYYEAPPSTDVPAEMARLIAWCNTAGHSPFIMAAVAHLWLVTIHPFDDGNGRISRTLADMFLARLDVDYGRYYSMSAEINRNKKSYYEILERTQKGGLDITEWLLWFFGCLENAVLRASGTIERTLQKAAYWERFCEIGINERQRKVINRLWDGFDGKLTSSKCAKICHCSQDTALRDINDLIAKGMLRPGSEGGRSANYILPE